MVPLSGTQVSIIFVEVVVVTLTSTPAITLHIMLLSSLTKSDTTWECTMITVNNKTVAVIKWIMSYDYTKLKVAEKVANLCSF